MNTGGAPLYETLEAAFPAGLLSEGMEHTIKAKVRRRLRDTGYRVLFDQGENWKSVIECFAVVALDGLYRSFGDNPWFWVVAWPGVVGAAAFDFWPEVGSGKERRSIAHGAAMAQLEAILVRAAVGDRECCGALPVCALRGLQIIGQQNLPAMPSIAVDSEREALRSMPGGLHVDRRDVRPISKHLPPPRANVEKGEAPSTRRRSGARRARRIMPGDVAFHVAPDRGESALFEGPGAADGSCGEPLPGGEQLRNGEEVRVVAQCGYWGKVETEFGLSGWIRMELLQLTSPDQADAE